MKLVQQVRRKTPGIKLASNDVVVAKSVRPNHRDEEGEGMSLGGTFTQESDAEALNKRMYVGYLDRWTY